MHKNWIVLLSIISLTIIGIIFFNMNNKNVSTSIQTESAPINRPTDVNILDQTPLTTEDSDTSSSTTSSYLIKYDKTGFYPAIITIKVGDTITFTNNSGRFFRPASNDHPTHSLYPEFDSKISVRPGGYWNFTFTKVGSWEYHDHEATDIGGTIIVQ